MRIGNIWKNLIDVFRLDSESNSFSDSEPPSLLTPAMQEVIRVRDIRKSMEQSRFFTPVCSPMDQSSENFNFPSSTPHDAVLQQHLTLDCSSDEEPVRKTSARVLRNRKTLQIDTTNSSMDSSTAADVSLPSRDVERRVIHKSHCSSSHYLIFNIHTYFMSLGKELQFSFINTVDDIRWLKTGPTINNEQRFLFIHREV